MSAKDQIKQIVDYFKRAPQLKDKTDGMAEGLLLGAQLADNANELSKETDASFKALQQEYTENGNGSQTTAEINVARDGELVLDDRLKRDFGNVTAQLAQIENEKASINYVDAVLMDIAKGGPEGLFNSLSTLTSTYPSGVEGIWLVLDSSFTDGAHSFMWDSTNSSWKDLGVYQSYMESDFPANNLVKNASFSDWRTHWQVNGSNTIVADNTLSLVSDGSSKYMRVTQSSTGYTPKKGDKIFVAARINFKTNKFLDARLHVRDWVTGGTFNSSIPLDTKQVDINQYVSMYVDVTSNFLDQVRVYVEANLTDTLVNEKMEFSKPLLLNLTGIFGAGNEPNQQQTIELLKKFGGWFDGNVTEFVTKKESKNIAISGEGQASEALEKVNAVTEDLSLTFNNIIKNGNFFNQDFIGGNSWKRNGVANTKTNNYITTFNATAKGQTLSQVVEAKKNHIYYFWAQVKATSRLVSLMVSNNVNDSKAHTGSGEFEFLSAKHIRDNDSGVNLEIRDNRESGWDNVSVKYVGAVDLTETFGAGNEPEVYEMDTFVKRLNNMWFDGNKNDILSIYEVDKYFKNVRRKKLKVTERQRKELGKFVETNVPKLVMTITYDDESSNIYDLAFPIHKSENVPGVFYVVPSRIGSRQVYNYGIADEWIRLREMNESPIGRIAIEHHTYAHWTVDNTSKEYLEWQIKQSQEMFWRNEIYPSHLSYPGGSHDFNTINVLQDYVLTGVTTSPVVNGYGLNPMRIHRYGMDNKSLADIKAFIDSAVLTGGWLVTYQHDLSTSGMSLGGFQVQTPANQLEIIRYAKSKGVQFVGLEKGLEIYAPHIYLPKDLERPSFAIQRNGIVVTN